MARPLPKTPPSPLASLCFRAILAYWKCEGGSLAVIPCNFVGLGRNRIPRTGGIHEGFTSHYRQCQVRPRRGLERFAWLPVPLLLMAIIAARAAGLRESYENDTLRLGLSFTFYTLASLGTLFLIGRSFLTSGLPGLLLLECGVVLWSLAGTVGRLVDPR